MEMLELLQHYKRQIYSQDKEALFLDPENVFLYFSFAVFPDNACCPTYPDVFAARILASNLIAVS